MSRFFRSAGEEGILWNTPCAHHCRHALFRTATRTEKPDMPRTCHAVEDIALPENAVLPTRVPLLSLPLSLSEGVYDHVLCGSLSAWRQRVAQAACQSACLCSPAFRLVPRLDLAHPAAPRIRRDFQAQGGSVNGLQAAQHITRRCRHPDMPHVSQWPVSHHDTGHALLSEPSQ